ncbi:MAG: DNA topoisomerase III [Verrucomicrobia bacterium]|nr:DNA topoisomerase III [Verrucomicrobiota bacterium]MCF7708246.1 DNA topoisomerase III [Verrucomicrobiota bacterium]
MGKKLIIAEKPSVANDIARALKGFTKKGDYLESENYVLSSAVGHMLELYAPEDQELKRGKWSFSRLPVIPAQFALRPIDKTAARLRLLIKLMKRKDVDGVINACDAGREGELIFRHICRHAKIDKPVYRLWLQSMTPTAIREGFDSLRSDEEMRPLAGAANCRSEADWLIGINGTRAMTAFNSKTGGFQLTTVGRVQTPTLTIVVEREEKIRNFTPRTFWEVHAAFTAEAGTYEGRWFDEKFSKDKNGDPELKPERIWSREFADAILHKCSGQPGIASEESKPATQLSPLLYDLTSLQREANNRFKFSARRTLQIAQSLYERHKVITYPRTDSRALPEDYLTNVRKVVQNLTETNDYAPFAAEIINNSWIKPNKRIFNNSKISDHFAIIPTSLQPKKLNHDEAALYDFITRRFLANFFPPAEFLVTTRITRVKDEPFKTEGRVLINPGWMKVYGKQTQKDNPDNLIPIKQKEPVHTQELNIIESQTKPPPRFSEATLLTAMESAGKMVEDDELRAAMSAKGLGTPATRASIIEGLIHEKYLLRQGRELVPTAKAFSLITLLRGIQIPELCSPELTGNWEFKLKQIEKTQLSTDEFMGEITGMTRAIVEKAKGYDHDTVPGNFIKLQSPCPKCGGTVHETYRTFQCEKCDFSIWKSVAGRLFEYDEAEKLLKDAAVGPLQGFRSKAGRPFTAWLKLSPEFKIVFDFGQSSQDQDDPNSKIDFSEQEPIGKCPKCGSRVFEDKTSYICENTALKNNKCGFRSGKIILQQPIDREQMQKLIETGKSDLLTKFISKRGKPFSAYLVIDEDTKKAVFKFEPRQTKKSKTSVKKVKSPKQ